ncbi:histidine phosphatase superfamily-domain-containing protein [Zychaea mexicana]|uniref:histidine phosphatase superfamily-domain-containing protein n=1 Tax=Zychaea mexicana TaxID=64656 RepID=UPI0022FE000E|nr:histidine phosphatase superfamily-domain-containing protein [Zychaea mexicana]KAI9474837.1 histidine phosphatase superfamily-domain-containing protein [Zychaea mexicana]
MPSLSSPQPPPSPGDRRGKHVVAVCCLDKKARSKPMRHILNRLLSYGDYSIVIFGDKTILDEEVENWPGCDFLICFFSDGFPLDKAIQYVKLRKPFTVNSVVMQSLLWDRRVVLAILDAMGIPTPPRLVVTRDGGPEVDPDAAGAFEECTGMDLHRVLAKYSRNTEEIKIHDDEIEVEGNSLSKTFIEKPADGENHNINIYYSREKGGGGRRLFRKIGNKSSEFDPELSTPQQENSWIYEQLMETENCEDIKLYTVGPTFIHAETRKSPTVDGLVKRNTDGKEIRYCTELSPEEEDIARKVSKAFGQTVCGLDILRVNGKSYVIDVNGWSFVKGSDYYYDQCARLLSEAFYRSVQRRPSMVETIPREIAPEHSWRIKGFVAVFRHADRTPKDKSKISTQAQPFIDLLDGSTQEVVFRQKHQLSLVAQAVDKSLELNHSDADKLRSLKEILEKKWDLPGTKVQVKPQFDKETGEVKKVQVNVKWGGEFTHAGLHQSRDLGENLRKDMNILNRNIMDDVKIFSSSERRVRATADVFARRFLGQPESIEGVISESKSLLDDSNAAKEQGDAVKRQLKTLIRPGYEIPQLQLAQVGWPKDMPQPHVVMQEISLIMSRLRQIMRYNWQIKDVDQIQRRWCCFESPALFRERWEKQFKNFCDHGSGDESDEADIRNRMHSAPDPAWIPELYDALKYDALHNRPFLQGIFSDPDAPAPESETGSTDGSSSRGRPSTDSSSVIHGSSDLRKLYKYVRTMFDFVAPQEYGITDEEKKSIGLLIGLPLLKSILSDLRDIKYSDNPKTRLYFTKESHVHALLNLVYLSGVPTKVPRNALPELDFLTQITFELYERNKHSEPGKEYSLRIGFSSGAHYKDVLDIHLDAEHCLKVAPRTNLIPHLSLEEVLAYHNSYLNLPNLESIERQIEERKLYYVQEDNQ